MDGSDVFQMLLGLEGYTSSGLAFRVIWKERKK